MRDVMWDEERGRWNMYNAQKIVLKKYLCFVSAVPDANSLVVELLSMGKRVLV